MSQHEHSHNNCPHGQNFFEQKNINQENNGQYEQKKHQREVKSAFANYKKDMIATYGKIFGDNKIIKYFDLVRQRKRQKMQKAIEANQKFLNLIVDSLQNQNQGPFVPDQNTQCHNISKIRTTVKQFFREWCAQSPQIKDYVMLVQLAKKYLKKKNKILVPGCGLGRLALDLIQAGFNAQGNQVTYFMLYGSNFILNFVDKKQQFEIYPFIHTLTNHEDQQNMFRSVRIPDKVAMECVGQQADFSMAAGQFTEIYQQSGGKFDGVVACFFIDTANNIFAYIDTIYNVLVDGGIWINYGPLLYHYKDMLDQISIQLSWEQVKAYILLKGFTLLQQNKTQTTYCHDPLSGYTHIYQISATVWRKPLGITNSKDQ